MPFLKERKIQIIMKMSNYSSHLLIHLSKEVLPILKSSGNIFVIILELTEISASEFEIMSVEISRELLGILWIPTPLPIF